MIKEVAWIGYLLRLNLLLFPVLSAGCFLLYKKSRQAEIFSSQGTNPVFQKFQRIYFVVYLPAVYADWLQIPYLYKIYDSYGFLESQIAVLYIFGLLSSLLFGSCAGSLSQRYGRKPLCLIFVLVYCVSAGLKTSSNYGALLVSEILRGAATSVLFAAMEAWYVHEHTETHDFPKEWIPLTFNKASFWNGILAIGAGLFSFIPGNYFPDGPKWPVGISIPCFLFSGFMIATKWSDNCGNGKPNFKKSLIQGFRSIVADPRIMLIGAIQSIFESIIVVFAFLWTPVLTQVTRTFSPPLGLIFANFMLCSFAGASSFQVVTRLHFSALAPFSSSSSRFDIRPRHALVVAVGVALLAFIPLAVNAHFRVSAPLVTLAAFMTLQFAAGLYFPAMSRLRKSTLPAGHQLSIANFFRAPLYLIACAGLFVLHEDASRHGNSLIFIASCLLISSALVSSILLATLLKRTEQSDVDDDVIPSTAAMNADRREHESVDGGPLLPLHSSA